MEMLNTTNKSVSESKESPMAVFELAKKIKESLYNFNRNKSARVVLSPDTFESLVLELKEKQEKLERMEDKMLDLQIEKIALSRINQINVKLIPAEQVIGSNWEEGLEDIPDEWE